MTSLIRKMILLFAAVALLPYSFTSAAAQEKITPGTQEKITPGKDYPCGKYKGDLAVFGRLTTVGHIPSEGAIIKLTRNGGDTLIDHTNSQGLYCIRYSAGPDIATLWFEDGDVTCIEQIDGSKDHFINKVLDNKCAQYRLNVAVMGSSEAVAILGSSELSKKFVVLQIGLSNTLGGPLRVMAYQVERGIENTGQTAGQSPQVIASVDPAIVELLVSRQKSAISVLKVGPVSLVHVNLHGHAGEAERFIRDHALRLNDIIPENQAVQKLVFVAKSKTMPDNWPMQGGASLVIQVQKLTKDGEATLHSTPRSQESLGSPVPGNDGNAEAVITAVTRKK